MANKQPKKRGRQSKYEQLHVSQKLKSIEGWARHGSTLEEIAKMLNVSVATLHRWKGQYCEFREALRVGAREANGEILHSAFDQAVGYYAIQREVVKLKKVAYEKVEDQTIILRDARGSPVLEDVEKVVEFEEYFPPDPRMTIFMLTNRIPEEYRQKVEVTEKDDGNTGVVELPSAEVANG